MNQPFVIFGGALKCKNGVENANKPLAARSFPTLRLPTVWQVN